MNDNPSRLCEDFSRLAVLMKNYSKTSHSVYDLKYDLVWAINYHLRPWSPMLPGSEHYHGHSHECQGKKLT